LGETEYDDGMYEDNPNESYGYAASAPPVPDTNGVELIPDVS
jgi:hypothetical protein